MAQPFIGEVRLFAGSFVPRGWSYCDGQLLPINQNTALFSILGTTYGGNGQTTFALPNLMGRMPVHSGNSAGPGLTARTLGQAIGEASHTLVAAEMPLHTHQLRASSAAPTVAAADGHLLAKIGSATPPYHDASNLAPAVPAMMRTSGSGAPHENHQPYLALSFIIAVQGIFPSQS